MIVEMIGTGGAGKSTLEPLVAAGLDIPLFAGGKRQALSGEPLTAWQTWRRRMVTVLARPGLFLSAFVAVPGSIRKRAWFAMDLCRREHNARIVSRQGHGVLASGPLHAVCQGSARFSTDLGHLISRITTPDVYVVLVLDPDIASHRLADRLEVTLDRVSGHRAWTDRYERVAEAALSSVSSVVVRVDADRPPGDVAADIVDQIRFV